MIHERKTMQDVFIKKKDTQKSDPVATKKIAHESQKYRIQLPEGRAMESFPKRRKSVGLWVIATISIIALTLTIGGLFSGATISLVPKKISQTIDIPIIFSQDRTAGWVFFGTVTQAFTKEQQISSDAVATESKFASGTVRIFNSGTEPFTIASGTIIKSLAGKNYLITKSLTVPGQVGDEPGTGDVTIKAQEAGHDSNDSKTDFDFVQKNKNVDTITIRGTTDIGGGVSISDPLVTSDVTAQTTETLREAFHKDESMMRNRLAEELPDTMIMLPIIIPPSGMITKAVHDNNGARMVGEEIVTIMVANKNELGEYLAQKLSLTPARDVMTQDLTQVSMTSSNLITPTNIPNMVTVRATGVVELVGIVDPEKIKEKILGVRVGDVKKALLSVPEIDSFHILMRPPWRRVVPEDTKKVTVLVH